MSFFFVSSLKQVNDPFPPLGFSRLNLKAKTHIVGVMDRLGLNQLVNLYCVFSILDGDAKKHKVYTGSGNGYPTSSSRDRSCIPCTEMLVVGGYKQGERGLSPRSLRGVVWIA